MKPFSLLIKPASADCNLRCEYCFYLDHCSFYPETKVHRMSTETLERMIQSYMATDQPNYAFGWQGGEPTLMGVDFFRKVTEFQSLHGRDGAMVSNGVQTNGVLLDDEFAAHFAKYHFLVGVSVDGPERIHDIHRLNMGGRGTHAQVMRGIERLKAHNVEFNILVLVSDANVGHAKEVYQYFRDLGINYLQFIPCVEFAPDNTPLPFAITGPQWGEFLCEIFDQWQKSDTRTVSIRHFDSMLSLLVDDVRNVCHMGRNCRQYFVVEHNGDVFPCDFFVRQELLLGNVHRNEWPDLQESPVYKEFGERKPQWHNVCAKCAFLHYCAGDCLKHRTYGNITNPRNLSWLCEGWKTFFQHALPRFKRLAESVRRERARAAAPPPPSMGGPMPRPPSARAPGRNDPCPCGSGRKYKKCCMKGSPR